jgi:hypothetical protein
MTQICHYASDTRLQFVAASLSRWLETAYPDEGARGIQRA